MKLVVILSNAEQANAAYVLECVRDSLCRGECPFGASLVEAMALKPDVPVESTVAEIMAFAAIERADMVALYCDLGLTPRMKSAIEHAHGHGVPIVMRSRTAPGKDMPVARVEDRMDGKSDACRPRFGDVLPFRGAPDLRVIEGDKT